MQDTLDIKAAHRETEVVRPDSHSVMHIARRVRSRRRWLVVAAILIFSDVLLAIGIWQATFMLRDAWGLSSPSAATMASVVPNIIAWIGLRAALGLYPGYG